MAFFGRYNEVMLHSRLVWTNDEGGEDGAVTTVTFEERGAETLVVMHDLYPSKRSTVPSHPGVQVASARRSSNWTTFSSPCPRAWNGHEVVVW